ncbi:uncharacterized protein [Panulirus ornatus]|uniref:uncharacterized protein isoform X2 n=1 Tax=Panulirus ornatus TaxID=150431 RepID=UPI003A8924C0
MLTRQLDSKVQLLQNNTNGKMANVMSAQLILTLWVFYVCMCVMFAGADSKTDTVTPENYEAGGGTTVDHGSALKKHSSKPLHTTDRMGQGKQGVSSSPSSSFGNNSEVNRDWRSGSSSGDSPVRESSSKRNTSSQGGAAARELESATSLVGNLLLLLISVVIAGSLFVMLLCFVHKWRENMSTSRYPRVVYSMLRQSEDEPEDVLGEILINIGLAAPEDARPLTPSSSETSESPQPSEHEVDINNLDGSKFTTIPLKSDEVAKRLMAPEPDESDEVVMVVEASFYSLLYWLFALVMLFPPDEMVAAGLTIESLLGSWLGSQMTHFIQYHVRRTALTFMVHTLLLPGYILMLIRTEPWLMEWANTRIHPYTTVVVVVSSLFPLVVTTLMVANWWRDNWQRHPLSRTLALYTQGNATSPNAWITVASDVNIEFRRVDKFSTKANSVCRVVATDSWLMKLTAYKVHLIHQRDAVLSLESSIDHQLSQDSSMGTQLLNIRVTSIRDGIASFSLRLSSLEYTGLESKIANPVVNARQIVVVQSLSDRFHQAFLETVNLNPQVTYLDVCCSSRSKSSRILAVFKSSLSNMPFNILPFGCLFDIPQLTLGDTEHIFLF